MLVAIAEGIEARHAEIKERNAADMEAAKQARPVSCFKYNSFKTE